MFLSQIFAFLHLICSVFQLILKFDKEYLIFSGLPWYILITISTIILMTEFQKYIVKFDLITFLGFKNKFCSRFKKFTNLTTIFTYIVCLFHLLLVFVRYILVIIIFKNDGLTVYIDFVSNL